MCVCRKATKLTGKTGETIGNCVYFTEIIDRNGLDMLREEIMKRNT